MLLKTFYIPACNCSCILRPGPSRPSREQNAVLSAFCLSRKQELSLRGSRGVVRSSSSDMAANESEFDLSKYRLAEVAQVRQDRSKTSEGNIEPVWEIVLKMQETNRAINVFVGDLEGTSLKAELSSPHQPQQVTKVCITALVQNTYFARVYYLPPGSTQEVSVDSRTSDAINMAVRFGAAVYINKAIADRLSQPIQALERKHAEQSEIPSDIVKTCKEALSRHHDPTVVQKMQLQVAIREDRFEDASKIRNEIEKHLSHDRSLSLIVAIESALEDKRWTEAAILRDRLVELMDGVQEQNLTDA